MNILCISSILPIPDKIPHNDFVFHIYIHYRKQFPEDQIVIIKPIKFDFNLLSILKGTTRLSKLKRQRRWEIHDFRIEIFPFFSTYSLRGLHAIITRSIFWINRKRIRRLFAEYDFDVLHAQYIFSDAVLARQIGTRYNIPYLVTSHNERFFFQRTYSKKVAVDILKGAAEVCPLSQTNANYFKSLGISNVNLAPLGFHEDFIKPQKEISRDFVRIFTASALIPLKNIDQVIRSVGMLKSKYNISLSVIGKGPERENLEKLVRELGLEDMVIFIDHIPHEQIANEMNKFDIFVMPSFFETFGRVYFECMAMGIPVICAKGSGIHGFFSEGEEGISVDHRNVDDIAAAIERLVSNPDERKWIGANGKKLVEAYTWDQVAADLRSRYDTAIQKMN